jgi:toxin HigB-1
MIVGFRCPDTQELWLEGSNRRFTSVAKIALRKLDQLAVASVLSDMAAPPGNRLEALKGNRKGQYSIRINVQYRICFVWTEKGPDHVEIIDYH